MIAYLSRDATPEVGHLAQFDLEAAEHADNVPTLGQRINAESRGLVQPLQPLPKCSVVSAQVPWVSIQRWDPNTRTSLPPR